jgi:hypothetical protein
MAPSCRQKGVGAHFGRSARIETKAESIYLLLYRELEQDLNAKFRYFSLLLGKFSQENERSPYGQTAPEKEYYQYRPDHTLAGSQNPESKAGKVQEKIGETMAETKGRIEQAVDGPEWQQKAQARGR